MPPEPDRTAVAERIRDHNSKHRRLEHVNEHTTTPAPAPAPRTLAQDTGKSKGVLARLDLLISNERMLPGMFGAVRLMHARENVDLSRINAGLCGFCCDHDATAILGIIERPRIERREFRAVGKMVDIALAKDKLREIKLGLRRGISPGFLVHAVEPSKHPEADTRGYDVDVILWEPYEVSTTGIPRNADARITGVFSMDTTAYRSPPLLSTSDPSALHAEALRMALDDGQFSGSRADVVTRLLGHYDAARADGKTSDEAAQIAAQQVGTDT